MEIYGFYFFLLGTTLNLLKFPIINPTPYRVLRRQERLKEDSEKSEEDLSINEQKQLNILKKQGYLIGGWGLWELCKCCNSQIFD